MNNPAKTANLSRRTLLAAGVATVGATAAGVFAWNRFDLKSRLFNPFTTQSFALEPVAGAKLANGDPAPGFSADDLKGHVTVLNFWASWCPPCIGEHPHVLALAQDRRLRIFGANYKDAPEAASRFLNEHGNPFAAVGADRSGFVSRAFGARGAPWTYVIDREGRVAFTLPGPIDRDNLSALLLPAIGKIA